MFTDRWTGALYFLMVLVIVLPGAFYLARKVPAGTKVVWGLVWICIFLAAMVLYRYFSGSLVGLRP